MAKPNFEIKVDTGALRRAFADLGISAETAGRQLREAIANMPIDYDCLKKPYKPTTIFNTVRKVRFR